MTAEPELSIEASVEEVHALMATKATFTLLDCRTAEEHEFVRLPDSQHIPMDEIPGRVSELNHEAHIVVYCHAGVRSRMVCDWLRQHGFQKAQSMVGGIDQWALKIDTDIQRY